jgi:hypothetical protein
MESPYVSQVKHKKESDQGCRPQVRGPSQMGGLTGSTQHCPSVLAPLQIPSCHMTLTVQLGVTSDVPGLPWPSSVCGHCSQTMGFLFGAHPTKDLP